MAPEYKSLAGNGANVAASSLMNLSLLRTPVMGIFLCLQLLDLLTTLVGFRLGASEASPFIAKLIHLSTPAAGVTASKFLGIGLAFLCLALNRPRILRWANFWYGALVLWNLGIILIAFGR